MGRLSDGLFATAALRAGIAGEKAVEFLDCVTTDDALEKCSEEERTTHYGKNHDAYGGISELPGERRDTGGSGHVSNVYGILGKTEKAEELIERF